jgi:hypothetical protein
LIWPFLQYLAENVNYVSPRYQVFSILPSYHLSVFLSILFHGTVGVLPLCEKLSFTIMPHSRQNHIVLHILILTFLYIRQENVIQLQYIKSACNACIPVEVLSYKTSFVYLVIYAPNPL